MAHIRQSRPDYVLGFQVKVLKTFQVVPSSLDSGKEQEVWLSQENLSGALGSGPRGQPSKLGTNKTVTARFWP